MDTVSNLVNNGIFGFKIFKAQHALFLVWWHNKPLKTVKTLLLPLLLLSSVATFLYDYFKKLWGGIKILLIVLLSMSISVFFRAENMPSHDNFRFFSLEILIQPLKKSINLPMKNKIRLWKIIENYTCEKEFPLVKNYNKITAVKEFPPVKNYRKSHPRRTNHWVQP